ncbi:MAG: peptide-methionine (S)-S-oxide reductase, partial [Pseudomonadota bacterium]
RGHSYRTAIFADENQQEVAQAAIDEADALLGGKVVTPVLEVAPFYDAEEYHQDYYLKNPLRYRVYRYNCGRDATIERVWSEAAEQS